MEAAIARAAARTAAITAIFPSALFQVTRAPSATDFGSGKGRQRDRETVPVAGLQDCAYEEMRSCETELGDLVREKTSVVFGVIAGLYV
jgi:hypothetical protein